MGDVQRLVIIGFHQPKQSVDDVVDIGEGTRLLPVAVNVDNTGIRRLCHLAADRGRRLGALAVPCAVRSERITDPRDRAVDAVIAAVGVVQFFREQFFLAEREGVEAGVGLLVQGGQDGDAAETLRGERIDFEPVRIDALARGEQDLADGPVLRIASRVCRFIFSELVRISAS